MLLLSASSALVTGCLQPLGLLWLLLAGGCLFLSQRPEQAGWIRVVAGAFFLVLVAGLFTHLLPGFNNLQVLDKVRFSPDSAPFTLYLNFDKTAVGLLIYLLVVKPSQPGMPGTRDGRVAFTVLGLLAGMVLPQCARPSKSTCSVLVPVSIT